MSSRRDRQSRGVAENPAGSASDRKTYFFVLFRHRKNGSSVYNSNCFSIKVSVRGYGLVVECVLAKDEIGVRFSVPAQIKDMIIGQF